MLTAAWWTGDMIGPLHEYLGYAAGSLLGLRVAWGFAGDSRARFATFVKDRRHTLVYARRLIVGTSPRHVGHNPLGAWMIMWLLACVGALSITGWLYTTDWLWGYAWLANLHAAIAWVLLGSVVVHVAAVFAMSWRHRENLVEAMITGKKRPPSLDDVA